MIKTLNSFDLKDKRVLLRVDFNVPIVNDRITDNFRIVSSLPTIKYCLRHGAKIIIMSHLGRPKGNVIPEMSLISVGEALADLLESKKLQWRRVKSELKNTEASLSTRVKNWERILPVMTPNKGRLKLQ